jgi:hypothetical protein
LKILNLLFFSFCSIQTFAQKDTVITFADVVKVDSVAKETLYIRSRDWFNSTFKDSKEVLQIQDKEAGEISGKAGFKIYIPHKSLGVENGFWLIYSFKVTFWTKDGRYKYEITDIDNYAASADGVIPFGIYTSSGHTDVKYPMTSKKKMDEYFAAASEKANNEVKVIITGLKSSMAKNATPDF